MKKPNALILFLFLVTLSFSLTGCRDWEAVHEVLKQHAMDDAEYVGTETCALCHEEDAREFPLSTHARIAIPFEGSNVEGCEMCHGPGSKHVDVEGKDGAFIINPTKDPNACFACHLEKKAEFRLPHHHPVLEGQLSCTSCHSPHGPESRPGTLTDLEGVNASCTQCHKEQDAPFVYRHEAVQEGCTTCHAVHGSINDKMLIARDANLCLRCHAQAAFPEVGNSNHSGRMPEGTCWSAGCHTGVHGSNFDEHLRY